MNIAEVKSSDAQSPSRPRQIQVILKTVERCNIACTYCYFFFKGDTTFAAHPPIISRDTVTSVAAFLRQGVVDLQPESMSIAFHGGEPMLQRPRDFDFMCERLRTEIGSHTRLKLSIQTNATLINNVWLDLLERHRVSVGVSIDGPARDHDRVRVDKKGRGTHMQVAAGVRMLVEAYQAGRIPGLGALCVAHPSQVGRELYHFFVKEMGLKGFDILLPGETHDTFNGATALAYGNLLNQVFDAWAEDDDPTVDIRIIAAFLAKLRGHDGFIFRTPKAPSELIAVTVASDGSLFVDDTLRVVESLRPTSDDTIFNTSLR